MARRAPCGCATRPSWPRPARVPPGALQRAGSDRAAVGGDRRRGARFRAGAARGRPRQRRAPRTSTLEACARAGVEVVRSLTAQRAAPRPSSSSARMLSHAAARAGARRRRLARRPRARRRDGRPGRHAAGGAHDGAAARRASASRILGYDPALHATRPRRGRAGSVSRCGLRELVERPTRCACSSTTSAATTACSATASCATASRTRCWSAPRIRGLFDEIALATALTERAHRRGLARQRRARRARPGAAAARHRDAAGDAARRRDDARVAPAQRLGGGAADRRAARGAARRARAPSFKSTIPGALADLEADRCRREVGDALLAPARPPRPAPWRRSSRCRAWPFALAISPSRRAISLASRAVSAATSISTCSASRVVADHRDRCVAARRRPKPRRRRTASPRAELRQRLQQRRASRDERRRRRSRSSGTRCAGRQVHLAAQVAAAADHRLQLAPSRRRPAASTLLELRLRIGRATMPCSMPAPCGRRPARRAPTAPR